MPPGALASELERIGHLISRWRAEIKFFFWIVITLAVLWLSGVFDILVQFDRPGRIFFWLVVTSLFGIAIWRTKKVLSQRYTIQAVASIVESHFPQLDNRLINFLQFSNDTTKDPFKEAYVKRGIPEWNNVDVEKMRNKKALKWSMIGMGIAVTLLAIPCTIQGKAWVVAIWRIVNPFSNVQPISMTSIVNVDPGNTTVLQGNPMLLKCNVKGKKGHYVSLDIKPSDNNKTTYVLGRVDGGDVKEWPYRIPKVTTDLEYRFRAGDAPSPKWFKVKTRPPLAFVKVTLNIKPPEYLGIAPKAFDGMGEPVQVFQGSEVEVTVKCNTSASSVALSTKGSEPVTLLQGEDDKTWFGKLSIKDGNTLKVAAVDTYKETAEATINYEMLADKPPVIQITKPKGRVILGPDGLPNIEFTVVDDYGVSDVTIERVPTGTAKLKEAIGIPVKNWQNVNEKMFAEEWKGLAEHRPLKTEPAAFRVVVKDNFPMDGGHIIQSSMIFFDFGGSIADMEKKKEDPRAAKVVDTLGKIIDLQRSNLATTRKLYDAIAVATPEQCNAAQEQQKNIRQMAGEILKNPMKPLGPMTMSFKELYEKEMLEVISTLSRVADTKETAANKTIYCLKSVAMEEKILRQLTNAEAIADKTQRTKKISGLLVMMEALINGQTKILTATKDYLAKNAPVGKTLVDQQDSLAADMAEFGKSCQREAATLMENDKNFAESLTKVAEECENKKVRPDMLKAAEELDANNPKAAEPIETTALIKLKELQAMLREGQLAEAQADAAKATEELHLVKEKLNKLAQLEAKIVESMKAMEAQKDMSAEERDEMEEDIKALKLNMEQALLQVPTDLNIFKELQVGNEAVEDVFEIFEEVRITKEQEENLKNAVNNEIASMKDDGLLEALQKAAGRLDDLETWLKQTNQEEKDKFVTENFDKEEMKFQALGALGTQAEDIIGDLVKQSEEAAKKAEDSATNQVIPDLPMGWDVMEGRNSSFLAKGKSGNQAPDHKEQDGRGNIGRQGMADGESASSGGTVGEGDNNIEERRTPEPLQSGQVQLDGKADTKATGGGKQASGSADGVGQAGNGSSRRMDSTAQGSMEGLKSLMEKTEAMHVKASLMNLRTTEIGSAMHHIRQADDAINRGMPISEVKELLKRTTSDLKRASTDLSADVADSIDSGATVSKLDDVVEGGTDLAPKAYKDLVAEYYKALTEQK
ncbi:MAG: hypothetical protein A2283_03950 [Lentisphaerae bacterium RIFOXYA12_FULL_48_11]|nr:MAG: hypothetical protein A2283_03950 [Lentisphaerae bacterium RIFOXYA12_FULL_48_11]